MIHSFSISAHFSSHKKIIFNMKREHGFNDEDDFAHKTAHSSTEEDVDEASLSEGIRKSLQNLEIGEKEQPSPSPTTQENNHTSSTKLNHKKSADGGTIVDPIYIPTPSGNDTWELTWPIWHMLPHLERKSIALQNGFRNIGDFEEEVILSRVLNDETSMNTTNGNRSGYKNGNGKKNSIFGHPNIVEQTSNELSPNGSGGNTAKRIGPTETLNENGSQCSDDESSVDDDDDALLLQATEEDDKNVEEGGFIINLPDELILHHIFVYLSTEYFALCALVSSHWRSFTRSELAYKEVCKRSYLNQSKRKTLHVARFGSYRTMLEERYRLKTGCGVYVLKCTKVKTIQRDMWTEIPFGAILESTYYRYLYFFENGTVLYNLTHRPPHEQIPIFRRIISTKETKHAGIFGTYQTQKDQCVVCIQHPWHHVRLFLKIVKEGDGEGSGGRFWSLQFDKHQSSASNNFDEYWSRDLVEYDVPTHQFLFIRDWRL